MLGRRVIFIPGNSPKERWWGHAQDSGGDRLVSIGVRLVSDWYVAAGWRAELS